MQRLITTRLCRRGGGLKAWLGKASTFHGRQPRPLYPLLQQQNRTNSSTNNNNGSDNAANRPKHIPPPSWSIVDLELNSKHPPLPKEDLERLSRLALIDICNQNDIDKLNQDLANMLHMVKQVTEFSAVVENDDDLSCSAHIYDAVRGVTAAPLRKDNGSLQEEDKAQAQQVWNSLLQPKTIRKGGSYEYFAIATGADDESSSKSS